VIDCPAMRVKLASPLGVLLLTTAAALSADQSAASSKSHGRVVDGTERLLYVTNKTGVSIYDINDKHKLLRSFEVPDTAEYMASRPAFPSVSSISHRT